MTKPTPSGWRPGGQARSHQCVSVFPTPWGWHIDVLFSFSQSQGGRYLHPEWTLVTAPELVIGGAKGESGGGGGCLRSSAWRSRQGTGHPPPCPPPCGGVSGGFPFELVLVSRFVLEALAMH